MVIFGAGVFTGGLLVDYVSHSHQKTARRPQANVVARPPTNNAAPLRPLEILRPPLAEKMGKQFVQQLNDTLLLTPEQRGKIEKIIAYGQDRNRELWTNIAPKMRAVIEEVNQQIRSELTPEQLAQFEELLKRPARRPQNTNAPGPSVSGSNIPPTSFFKQRLEASRGNAMVTALPTPENQMRMLELEKDRLLDLAKVPSPAFPPPPTNTPGL